MRDYDPMTSFGYAQSLRYDTEDTRGDEEQTVAFLAGLAGGRDALELAVGTGRIALPLAAAGVAVDGIEMSPHMVPQDRPVICRRRGSPATALGSGRACQGGFTSHAPNDPSGASHCDTPEPVDDARSTARGAVVRHRAWWRSVLSCHPTDAEGWGAPTSEVAAGACAPRARLLER